MVEETVIPKCNVGAMVKAVVRFWEDQKDAKLEKVVLYLRPG